MGNYSGSGCGLAFAFRKPWAQPRWALRSRINLKPHGHHITWRPLPAANATDNPNFPDSLLAPARSSNMSYAVSDSLLAIARIPATDGRAWGPGAPNHAFLFSAKPE